MKLFRRKNKDGFTLVEILVVLVIISLLIVVTVPGTKGIAGRISRRSYATKIELANQGAQLWAENNQACFTCTESECSNKCLNLTCQVDSSDLDEKICELKLGFLASEKYLNYDDPELKRVINPINDETINNETVTIVYNKKDGSFKTDISSNDYATLYFNGNGASGGYLGSITCRKEDPCTLPNNTFIRSGFEFGGWSYQAVGGVSYEPSTSIKINKDTTLYASWRGSKYNLTFNGNTGEGHMESIVCDHGSPCPIPNNSFTKPNNTFSGWATAPSGASMYTSGGTITLLNDTTLYAKWSLVKYNVTFNGNGSTSGTMSPLVCEHDTNCKITSNSFVRTGHTFAGWALSSSGPVIYLNSSNIKITSNTTLYAKWTANTYSVSYNANGGSGAPAAQTKTYGVNLNLSTSTPTRTGHTFAGWNTNSSGTGTNYSSGASYTGNAALTLYARWTANKYTISFSANGGSGAPAAQTKTYGVNLTLTTAKPTRTGYTFKGWATTSGATTATYASGASYSGNAAATLYAVWKDETPPTCGSQSPATSTVSWTNTNKTFSVGCSDAGTGCKATTVSRTFTTDTDTGTITIEDKAGNTRNCSVTVKIDKSKPYTPRLDTVTAGQLLCLGGAKPTSTNCGTGSTENRLNDITCTVTCPASSWNISGQFVWNGVFKDQVVNGASSGAGWSISRLDINYYNPDGTNSNGRLRKNGSSTSVIYDVAGNKSSTLRVHWR